MPKGIAPFYEGFMESRRNNDQSNAHQHRRRHLGRHTSLAPTSAPPAQSRKEKDPDTSMPDTGAVFQSLRGVGAERARLQLALPKDHPVSIIRDELRGLYELLDGFIEAHSSRPSPGFGFKSVAVPAVQAEPLITRCNQVLVALTKVIHTPALDPLMVQSHQMANDMKMQLLGFRKFLADPRLAGGVPEDQVESIIQNSIMFQRVISEPMNDAASLAFGVAVRRGQPPS
jgi:hypothetical protein